jgi:hypothetical protein
MSHVGDRADFSRTTIDILQDSSKHTPPLVSLAAGGFAGAVEGFTTVHGNHIISPGSLY